MIFCPQERKKWPSYSVGRCREVTVSGGLIVHAINFGSEKIFRTFVGSGEILHFKHPLV